MSTRIFLLRHGTTAANLNNIFAGRTDEPLHEQGKKQLSEVAEKLLPHGITRIYSGPLPRTKMSAEILGEVTGANIKSHDAFNEIDLAHWDGLTKNEIREKYGTEYPTWLETPDTFSVANCETLGDVQRRAVRGTEQIFNNYSGEKIAVVSHLIVVRCLVLHYKNMPIGKFRSIKISNASITELVQKVSGEVEVILEEGEV